MQKSRLAFSMFLTCCLVFVVVGAFLFNSITDNASTRAATVRPPRTLHQPASGAHSTGIRQSITPNVATAGALLTYHGGAVVQNNSTTYAIFWEPPTLQDGTTAYVSPTYNSLIEQYFQDVGGSGLYNINTQYYQTPGGHIVNSSTFGGAWVDTSPFPPVTCNDSFTPGDCLSDKQIRNEILTAMSVNGWSGGLNSIFFFFTPKGEGSCKGDCAWANYCAYHAFFTDTNTNNTILYANIPYEGTDLQGCGAPASPNGDIDADSSINLISHEHMETVTDPALQGWLDAGMGEIGDKCGFQFGTLTLDGGLANVQWNGHYYVVQQEYSNATGACAIARAVTGRVYAGSDDNNFYAIDASNGTTAGTFTTGNSVVSSPTLVKGVAYVGSNDGSVYAFSTDSGTTLWSHSTGGAVVSSPFVFNGAVYVGSSDGFVYALKASTGVQLWRFKTGGPVISSPVVVNQVVYVGSSDHNLYALKTAHGGLNWQFPTGGIIDSRPLVFNNMVYAGSNDGLLYAVSLAGVQVATFQTSGAITRSSPIASGQNIYVGSSDGNVYALNKNTLSPVWQHSVSTPVLTTPAITYKTLYIGASDGYVYALDAIAGRQLWRQQIGTTITSSPKIIDGMLLIGSNDQNVYDLWANDGSLIWQDQTGGAVESSPAVVLTSL